MTGEEMNIEERNGHLFVISETGVVDVAQPEDIVKQAEEHGVRLLPRIMTRQGPDGVMVQLDGLGKRSRIVYKHRNSLKAVNAIRKEVIIQWAFEITDGE